jgi:hypothetical protein
MGLVAGEPGFNAKIDKRLVAGIPDAMGASRTDERYRPRFDMK